MRKIRIQHSKNHWDLETCRKSKKSNVFNINLFELLCGNKYTRFRNILTCTAQCTANDAQTNLSLNVTMNVLVARLIHYVR